MSIRAYPGLDAATLLKVMRAGYTLVRVEPIPAAPCLAGSVVQPPFGAVLDSVADKVAQLVTNIARERGRRLELAVLRCFARDQRVEELRIHTDAGGLELRAELIVAGEVAETVDLSDLHPERLWRDSGKPPA